eukprot:g52753.t1
MRDSPVLDRHFCKTVKLPNHDFQTKCFSVVGVYEDKEKQDNHLTVLVSRSELSDAALSLLNVATYGHST